MKVEESTLSLIKEIDKSKLSYSQKQIMILSEELSSVIKRRLKIIQNEENEEDKNINIPSLLISVATTFYINNMMAVIDNSIPRRKEKQFIDDMKNELSKSLDMALSQYLKGNNHE